MQTLTLAAWADALQTGAAPDAVIRKTLSTDSITPVPNTDATDSRRLRFVVSSSAVDRDRDIINQAGWRLEAYRKNPVVLYGHDYAELPIARAVDVHVEGDRLVADAEFVPAEVSPFAETVYQLIKRGFLNATSVGFRPITYTRNEERGGYDVQEAELYEFSVVAVPSNPDALVMARSAGVDTQPLTAWATKVLADTKGAGAWVPQALADKTLAVLDAVNAIAGEAAALPRPEAPTAPEAVCNGVANGTVEPTDVLVTLDGRAVADAALAPSDAVLKRGRVLSAKNESTLRQAVDLLTAVLAQLDAAPPAGDDTPPPEADAEAVLTATVQPPVAESASEPAAPPTGVADAVPTGVSDLTPPTWTPADVARLEQQARQRVRVAVQQAVMALTGRLPD